MAVTDPQRHLTPGRNDERVITPKIAQIFSPVLTISPTIVLVDARIILTSCRSSCFGITSVNVTSSQITHHAASATHVFLRASLSNHVFEEQDDLRIRLSKPTTVPA